MIAYDLKCRSGHQFEAWFKSLETFQKQRCKKMIDCPECGSVEIEMVFRPRAIRTRSSLSLEGPRDMHTAERIVTFLSENFEDVGRNFAEEARRTHYGETKARNIRGETTASEEKELREEGISFLKLMLPKPCH